MRSLTWNGLGMTVSGYFFKVVGRGSILRGSPGIVRVIKDCIRIRLSQIDTRPTKSRFDTLQGLPVVPSLNEVKRNYPRFHWHSWRRYRYISDPFIRYLFISKETSKEILLFLFVNNSCVCMTIYEDTLTKINSEWCWEPYLYE